MKQWCPLYVFLYSYSFEEKSIRFSKEIIAVDQILQRQQGFSC